MKRGFLSFPIYPNWIFTRLYAAGFRPRQQPVAKRIDVLGYTMCFTIQLPLKHWGRITTAIVRDVIKVGEIIQCAQVRIRKNLKWIGITIILNCVGLKPFGQ